MIFIWGTKMAGKKNIVNGHGFCEQCGIYGKNISYNSQEFRHIYYIPITPVGGKIRVIMECIKCSVGSHLREDDVPDIKESLEHRTNYYLDLLISGEKHMEDHGEKISCMGLLAGAVEMLYCLEMSDQFQKILSTLESNGLKVEYHQVLGQSLEFEGKLTEAIESYSQAIRQEPNNPEVLMFLASAQMNNKDAESASDSYEAAVRYSDNKFKPLCELLSVYEKLKDYQNLAETYEKCFRLAPDVEQDKKVIKAYKKACKKAGKDPVVV